MTRQWLQKVKCNPFGATVAIRFAEVMMQKLEVASCNDDRIASFRNPLENDPCHLSIKRKTMNFSFVSCLHNLFACRCCAAPRRFCHYHDRSCRLLDNIRQQTSHTLTATKVLYGRNLSGFLLFHSVAFFLSAWLVLAGGRSRRSRVVVVGSR